MSKIGQNLKAARARAGFTQKEVEAKLGLRELTLKDYETGRIKLPAAVALTLAEHYRTTVGELLGEDAPSQGSARQEIKLAQLAGFFSASEMNLLFMDPVIRAYLEDFREKLLDHSIFDLLCDKLTEKQKTSLALEILKVLTSLMGVDEKITREELEFLRRLTLHFGLEEKSKAIMKMASQRYLPHYASFEAGPGARHFLLWLLFFIAKSDGAITAPEFAFIEECADSLRINRSNFLFVKKFFVKEKF